jgi:23S rRNA pseudouridine1911/1915/1917 synthase
MSPEVFEATPGRLDRVVAEHLGVPRADAQRAIAAGRVTVDGRARPKSHALAGGERVEVEAGPTDDLVAEGPPLEVLVEDEHLLVVSKPAGLVTHPTEQVRTGTVVNRLLGMGVPLSSVAGPLRPGIVHRLDAGTSGLMVVAKDDETHRALTEMLSRHEVRRRYVALVRGVVEHDRFAVDAPLGRERSHIRVRPATGKEAETAFEVTERFARATMLEAAPRTGRTHQIRVHLSAIGHPILGDARYGGAGDDARALGLSRPFLHAAKLSFTHPVTRARVEAEAPLPDDLRGALDRARS